LTVKSPFIRPEEGFNAGTEVLEKSYLREAPTKDFPDK